MTMTLGEKLRIEERMATDPRVMGWKSYALNEHEPWWCDGNDPDRPCESWHPWTSAEDALEALEATDKNWLLDVGPNDAAVLDPDKEENTPEDWISAPTLPEAICLAIDAWLDSQPPAPSTP